MRLNWWRSPVSDGTSNASRQGRLRARPALERLEDRLSPSVSPSRPLLILPGVGGTFAAAGFEAEWFTRRGIEPEKLQIDPLLGVYDDLIKSLENSGYVKGQTLFVANYDWRMAPGPTDALNPDGSINRAALDGHVNGPTASSITDNVFQYGVDYLGYWLQKASSAWAQTHRGAAPPSVDIVAHSTGGLVTRAYMQSGAYNGTAGSLRLPEVENFFMMAVPNRGSPKAWNPLRNDWDVDLAYRVVLSKVIDRAYKLLKSGQTITGPDGDITPANAPDQKTFISRYVPTIRSLLATYDFLFDADGRKIDVNQDPAEANLLLLDLNDGLDLDYTLAEYDQGQPVGLPTADRVVKGATVNPFRFADRLAGAGKVISVFSGEYEKMTPISVVRRVGPHSPFDEVLPFTHFWGRRPADGETWYEEQFAAKHGDGTVPIESDRDPFVLPGAERSPRHPRIASVPINKQASMAAPDHTELMSHPGALRAILTALGKGTSVISTGLAKPSYEALPGAFRLGILSPDEVGAEGALSAILKSGLKEIATTVRHWAQRLDESPDLNRKLPFIDRSIRELIPARDLVDFVAKPLLDALADDRPLGVVGLAQRLAGRVQGLDVAKLWQSLFNAPKNRNSSDGQLFPEEFKLPLTLHREIVLAAGQFDLGEDLKALKLNLGGDVRVVLGVDLDLTVGMKLMTGEVFFDTSKDGELRVSLKAIPNLAASATLAGLQVDVRNHAADATRLEGVVAIDLKDPGPVADGRATMTELVANGLNVGNLFGVRFTGGAYAHLDLKVNFPSDNFPSLAAEFVFKWQFLNARPGGGSPFGERPEFAFRNVSLDLGKFISNVISPVLNKAKQVIEPLRPVLDFLGKRLPVISDLREWVGGGAVTTLDLLRLQGHDTRFLDAAIAVSRLASQVPSINASVAIDLGDFDLGAVDLRNEQGSLAGKAPNIARFVTDVRKRLLSDPSVPAAAREFFSKLEVELGGADPVTAEGLLEFPILKPAEAFRLFLGDDVSFVTYQLPTLRASYRFDHYFRLVAFLGVRVRGFIEVRSDLKFGYDTAGLRTYLARPDRNLLNLVDLADGLYVRDRIGEEDVPELTVRAMVGVAPVELGVPGFSVGGEGSINANVEVDLHDPNQDGRVRLSELIANATQGLDHLFNMTGEVTAELNVYAELAKIRYYYPLTDPVTLLKFNLTPERPDPPAPPADAVGDTLATALHLPQLRFAGGIYSGPATRVGDGRFYDQDLDVYKFTAPLGATLAAATARPDGGERMNAVLRLFSWDGRQLAISDEQPGYASLGHTFAAPGDYYLVVSGAGNRGYDPVTGSGRAAGSTGDYALTIRVTPLADVGNTRDTAEETGLGFPGGTFERTTLLGDNPRGGADVDMYRFRADSRALIRVSAPSGMGLRLWDWLGREVANHFADPFLNAAEAVLTFTTAPRDAYWGDIATYYTLGVSDYTNRSYNPTEEVSGGPGWQLDYTMRLALSPLEAGDALAAARDTRLGWNGGSYGTSGQLGDGTFGLRDVDVYRFEALAGATVMAQTGQPDAFSSVPTLVLKSRFPVFQLVQDRYQTNTYLRLFDDRGVELAAVNDGGDEWAHGRIVYAVPRTGAYYLAVSGAPNYAYDPAVGGSGEPGWEDGVELGPIGPRGARPLIIRGRGVGGYRLDLSVAAPLDVGDTIAMARATGLGLAGGTYGEHSRLGGIGGTRDVDLYRLDATLGAAPSAEALDWRTGARLTGEAVLRLFDADGNSLADLGRGLLQYTIRATGTYYVGVSPPANTAYSPFVIDGNGWGSLATDYRLSLAVTPAPDVGDTLADARVVELSPPEALPFGGSGTPADGRVFGTTSRLGDGPFGDRDVDVYRFEAPALSWVEAFAYRAGEAAIGLGTTLRLFDAGGREVAVAGAASTRISRLAGRAGAYYLVVSAQGNAAYDPNVGGSGPAGAAYDYALHLAVTPNRGPVVNLGPGRVVPEGKPVTIESGLVDPDLGDSHTFSWRVVAGNGRVVRRGAGRTLTFTPPDQGAYRVFVTVRDAAGVAASGVVVVTARNVAPAVSAGPDGRIVRGRAFVTRGLVRDVPADRLRVKVNYGDGTGWLPVTVNANGEFRLSHVYARAGVYTVTVLGSDEDGGRSIDTARVRVEVRPVGVALVTRGVGAARRLVARVSFAGGPPRELVSPFQSPGYRGIAVALHDRDSDGVFDSILASALREGKKVRSVIAL